MSSDGLAHSTDASRTSQGTDAREVTHELTHENIIFREHCVKGRPFVKLGVYTVTENMKCNVKQCFQFSIHIPLFVDVGYDF